MPAACLAGIARFNPDGTLDATFEPGAGADGQVLALAFDPTGKIYIGGNFTQYNGYPRDRLARLNGDLFLLNPVFSANAFHVSLFTFHGQSYALEYKTILDDAAWLSLPPVPGNGAIQTLTDPNPTSATRTYRVRTDPP